MGQEMRSSCVDRGFDERQFWTKIPSLPILQESHGNLQRSKKKKEGTGGHNGQKGNGNRVRHT